jgi:hypothetical protein
MTNLSTPKHFPSHYTSNDSFRLTTDQPTLYFNTSDSPTKESILDSKEINESDFVRNDSIVIESFTLPLIKTVSAEFVESFMSSVEASEMHNNSDLSLHTMSAPLLPSLLVSSLSASSLFEDTLTKTPRHPSKLHNHTSSTSLRYKRASMDDFNRMKSLSIIVRQYTSESMHLILPTDLNAQQGGTGLEWMFPSVKESEQYADDDPVSVEVSQVDPDVFALSLFNKSALIDYSEICQIIGKR